MIARLLIAAALLALPMVPRTPPFDAHLVTAYGSGPARDGIGALNFLQHTAKPVLFINVERGFPGMSLVGEVQITSWLTTSAGMTITAAVDDVSPDSLILTMGCQPVEPPVGSSAVVSGTVQSVSCPSDQSGCVLTVPITEISGNRCSP